MEQSPKTSFIPKQVGGTAQVRRRRSFNLLTFLAIVVFLATLAFSMGVFFYKSYADSQLQSKKEELAKLNSSFSINDIQDILTLQKRLETTKVLLDKHLSIVQLLDKLASSTQDKAQLTDFSFSRLNSGGAQIMLAGNTGSFDTTELQKRVFAVEDIFEKGTAVFSGISKTGDGKTEKIGFTVEGPLNTGVIAYTAASSSVFTEVSSTTLGASTSTSPLGTAVGTSTHATSSKP